MPAMCCPGPRSALDRTPAARAPASFARWLASVVRSRGPVAKDPAPFAPSRTAGAPSPGREARDPEPAAPSFGPLARHAMTVARDSGPFSLSCAPLSQAPASAKVASFRPYVLRVLGSGGHDRCSVPGVHRSLTTGRDEIVRVFRSGVSVHLTVVGVPRQGPDAFSSRHRGSAKRQREAPIFSGSG